MSRTPIGEILRDVNDATGATTRLVDGKGRPLNDVFLQPSQVEALAAGVGLSAAQAFWSPSTPGLAAYETQFAASRLTTLSLPNPYASIGQVDAPVHPCLLTFDEAWNGYLYWVAYTPLPGSVSQFENPCVAASNDMRSWVSPATNPLVNHPGGTNYNADTHLFMSADGVTMYLAFRVRTASTNSLKVMHTTNGVQWSSPVTILTGSTTTTDFGSPSIWWNGTGWTMVSHNLDAVTPWPLQRRVSSTADIYGAWGAPTTVTMAARGGRAWWHSCMVPVGAGRIIGIAQDNPQISGASGNLYYVESPDDGASFAVLDQVGITAGKYRSAIYPRRSNAEIVLDVLIGDLTSGTLVQHVVARPVRQSAKLLQSSDVAAAIGAGAALPFGVAFADSCVRADSGATPNPASCGANYTISSGTWGIRSNSLYPVASGRVLISAGTPNHRISAHLYQMTTGVEQWLIVRAVDGSNYYRIGIVSPTSDTNQLLAVQAIVGGGVDSTVSLGPINRGDMLSVSASGALITVAVNGQVLAEFPAVRHLAGAQCGIQANAGATTDFRSIAVHAI